MEAISNLLVAVMDLFEAEGRTLHRGVIRLLVRSGAIICAAVLGVVGLLLLVIGIELALAHYLGHHWALIIISLVPLGAAVGLFLYGRITPDRPEEGTVHPMDEHVDDAAVKPPPTDHHGRPTSPDGAASGEPQHDPSFTTSRTR